MKRKRDVKRTHQATTNPHNNQIKRRKHNLPPRRKIKSPIHIQPENATQTVREPTSEQGHDQTKEIIEDGDGFGDNPCHDPEDESDTDP